MYSTPHATTREYTFLPNAHATFFRKKLLLDCKSHKRTEILQSMFSDHNRMNLEINNRRKFEEFTNIWKLINILQNILGIKAKKNHKKSKKIL